MIYFDNLCRSHLEQNFTTDGPTQQNYENNDAIRDYDNVETALTGNSDMFFELASSVATMEEAVRDMQGRYMYSFICRCTSTRRLLTLSGLEYLYP